MRRRHLLKLAAAGGALPLVVGSLAAAGPSGTVFKDVLDSPAQRTPLAARGLLNGLARAGQRVVAVGQRGHVLFSDDAGKNWTQAEVPVSSDLVAVHFANAQSGWAVGHDGVVLQSRQAGATWTRQLDGRSLGETLVKHYAAAGDAKWQDEAKRFAAQGPENPFLDVWFDDAERGTIVGAFGLLLRTRDGGSSWEPAMHLADNPKALHLYCVRRIGGTLWAAGEQGLLLKADESSGRWTAQATPYPGTFFGLVGHERTVLAHGLRGNVVRSTDGGTTWAAVKTGLAVGLTGSTRDERGRIFIASQAGHVLMSADEGASFTPLKLERPGPAAAVIAANAGTLVMAGPRGVAAVPLP